MTRNMIVPILFGLVGAAILCSLGVWQIKRLAWKNDLIAQIEAKIDAEPVRLPQTPRQSDDVYRAVMVDGTLKGPEVHYLTSIKGTGPGFRIIRAFETSDGRDILIDLGFIREAEKSTPRPASAHQIIGNLIWPNETDSYIPDPNLERNIWFARDVEKMSAALSTEPIMIAARALTPERPETPQPVTARLTNDHLEYAITWFSLMAIWIGMTAFLLYRIKQAQSKTNELY
jgi:surfeit locus 1 family protein